MPGLNWFSIGSLHQVPAWEAIVKSVAPPIPAAFIASRSRVMPFELTL